MCYDPDLGEYVSTDIPLPTEGGGGIFSPELQTIRVLDRGEYGGPGGQGPRYTVSDSGVRG